MKIWLMASRPRTLPAAIAPVLVGTAAAFEGPMTSASRAFAAALVGSSSSRSGQTSPTTTPTPSAAPIRPTGSGPVRVTAAGLVAPRRVLAATWIAFGVAVAAGVYLRGRGAGDPGRRGRLDPRRRALHGRAAPLRLRRARRAFRVPVLRPRGGQRLLLRPGRAPRLAAFALSVPSAGWPRRSSSSTTCATSTPTAASASGRSPCAWAARTRGFYALLLAGAYRRASRRAARRPGGPRGRCWRCSRCRSSGPAGGGATRSDGPSLNAALAQTGMLLAAFSALLAGRAAAPALACADRTPRDDPVRAAVQRALRERPRAARTPRAPPRAAAYRRRPDRARRGGAPGAARRRRPGEIEAELRERCAPLLEGAKANVKSLAALIAATPGRGVSAQAVAAVDLALHDLVAKIEGRPVWQLLGAAAATPSAATRRSSRGNPRGGRRGRALGRARASTPEAQGGRDGDLEQVGAVRERVGPGPRIRVDANGAWPRTGRRAPRRDGPPRSRARRAARRRPRGHRRVRRRVRVPVAADESVADADDARRAVELGACDLATIKVAKVGGIAAALEVADEIPVYLSSALDGPVGHRRRGPSRAGAAGRRPAGSPTGWRRSACSRQRSRPAGPSWAASELMLPTSPGSGSRSTSSRSRATGSEPEHGRANARVAFRGGPDQPQHRARLGDGRGAGALRGAPRGALARVALDAARDRAVAPARDRGTVLVDER